MMKLFSKVLFTIVALGVFFALTFALFGADFDRLFNQQACIDWFSTMKPYGWLVAIALFVGDLLLPVPATGVMAALGVVYGLWLGVLVSIVGSAAAGFLGYSMARSFGKKGARYLVSDKDQRKFQNFFNKWGGVAIIISRLFPVLPEVTAILAGLAGMSRRRFSAALLLGVIPSSFLFTYLGHVSGTEPFYGMLAATLLPVLLWPFFLKWIQVNDHGRQ